MSIDQRRFRFMVGKRPADVCVINDSQISIDLDYNDISVSVVVTRDEAAAMIQALQLAVGYLDRSTPKPPLSVSDAWAEVQQWWMAGTNGAHNFDHREQLLLRTLCDAVKERHENVEGR